MEEKEKGPEENGDEKADESLFQTEEIKIEEMSIDGICGVY
ncbi:MAG: mycofactocin precursor [Deltaproteobacteria bacterium]|nr:mycofactocin precursor [Deltaproteobacteria bacterium]